MSDRQDDDFLHQLREPPSRSFSDTLYARLSEQDGRADTNGYAASPTRQTWRSRRVAWLAACAVALLLLIPVSPVARAQFSDWLRTIGGVMFEERTALPWSSAAQQEQGISELTAVQRALPLAEAQAQLPFQLRLPRWVPRGYEFLDDVILIPASEELDLSLVILTWCHSTTEECIRLNVQGPTQGAPAWLVGAGSIEEVSVRGQPAALTRGAWDSQSESWENGDVVTLSWSDEASDLAYHLMASQNSLAPADLIRMAESVP